MYVITLFFISIDVYTSIQRLLTLIMMCETFINTQHDIVPVINTAGSGKTIVAWMPINCPISYDTIIKVATAGLLSAL